MSVDAASIPEQFANSMNVSQREVTGEDVLVCRAVRASQAVGLPVSRPMWADRLGRKGGWLVELATKWCDEGRIEETRGESGKPFESRRQIR